MASGDTKTEALLNVLGNGGSIEGITGCCNTKTQSYIIDAINRIQNVENEVAEIINNPDVVDIVNTYADLQAYDTQHLGDKAVIRVLNDETHDGHSTYYRYDKAAGTWTYIGEDSGGGGGAEVIHVLTDDDKNYPAGNPNRIALWMLPDGIYTKSANIGAVSADGSTTIRTLEYGGYAVVLSDAWNSKYVYIYNGAGSKSFTGKTSNGTTWQEYYPPVDTINTLTSTSISSALSANQGKVLNDKINSISNYSTSEVNTGATWVDGSPIYKITVNLGTLPDSSLKSVNHNITNLSRVLKIEGYAFASGSSVTIPLPFSSPNYSGAVSVSVGSTQIGITSGTDRTEFAESYATIYYTKTS